MNTIPTPSELELERTKNIELRLLQYHVNYDNEKSQQANERQTQVLNSIENYQKTDKPLYARILQAEQEVRA